LPLLERTKTHWHFSFPSFQKQKQNKTPLQKKKKIKKLKNGRKKLIRNGGLLVLESGIKKREKHTAGCRSERECGVSKERYSGGGS
jgi:hypothetical protein